MLIRILDSNFKIWDILRKYTYCTYTQKFRGVGTFQVNARLLPENLFLLEKNRDFYVLFKDDIIGKVERIVKESDSEYEQTIVITGRLCSVVFTKRIIQGTLNYNNAYTYAVIADLVRKNAMASSNSARNIKADLIINNEPYLKTICSKVTKQYTGGYLEEEIEELYAQDKLGYTFTPTISPLISRLTNVTNWVYTIRAGTKRTKQNTQGNRPIVFSQSLSNIQRTEYTASNEVYCNVAYIAGEGEGAQRKWYERNINDTETVESRTGWNRNELWIDARDIQSEDVDGNKLTEAQYVELINQRVKEKAVENTREETYTATLTEANKQYTYGQDYYLGDFVTIIDDELGVMIDVQIVEVVTSEQDAREIIDIVFEYGTIEKDPTKEIKRLRTVVEQANNAIKYLEKKVAILERK